LTKLSLHSYGICLRESNTKLPKPTDSIDNLSHKSFDVILNDSHQRFRIEGVLSDQSKQDLAIYIKPNFKYASRVELYIDDVGRVYSSDPRQLPNQTYSLQLQVNGSGLIGLLTTPDKIS